MLHFVPDFAYFEPNALEYPIGQDIYKKMIKLGVPISYTTSHNRITGIPGKSPNEIYKNAKKTLVVGVRKTLEFDTSKPSADYALPLSTGCMGHCHYCYLQTTLGARPYIRVYVNIDEILASAKKYMDEGSPHITTFEAACTSDPLSTEYITGNLGRTITFVGNEPLGRLRFVSKYDDVRSLLVLPHRKHTHVRFSLNSEYVVRQFEPSTAKLEARMTAAKLILQAGYQTGFIIAPIIRYEGWQEGYQQLFVALSHYIEKDAPVTFELIQHRFTNVAKKYILERYPKTKLDLDESTRKYKRGKYGRGKWVYQPPEANEIDQQLRQLIDTHFKSATIEYFT